MRKSSRGNPWHDSKGRFCSGPQSGGVIKSEKTPEEYEARTRERFGNTKIGYDIKGKPNTFTTVSEVIAAQRAKGLEKPRQYKERKPPTGNNGRFAPTEQKCPKCGATLANGRCLKCGYPDIRKMENQQVAPQVRTLRKMGFTKVDDEDFRNQFGNSTVYIKGRKHTRTLVAVDNETGLVYCSWTNSKSGELVEARFDSVEEWENQGEYHNTDKPQRNWWVNRCKSIRENLKLSEIRLEECKVDEKGNRWYGATDSYGNRAILVC